MNSSAFERAHAARILVAITFHFDASRLGFLAEVLRALAEYPVASMHVVIVTNTFRQEELGLLRRVSHEVLPDKNASIRSYGDLSNPWALTWCHKPIIAKEFVDENDDRYTHFIYLENDVRLSFVNFCYFIEFRETLRGFGLLPSFVRVEYSKARCGFTTSDVFWPVYVPSQPHVMLGELLLVNLPNPYNPFFILDRELATEYVRSRSFDQEGSRIVCPWGLAERAAMGLCLERVPAPFQSRYVVPVSRQTAMTPASAWVWHLPNNYADNPRSSLGKVRMDRLFVGLRELSNDGSWGVGGPRASYWTGSRADGEREAAATEATRCEIDIGGELKDRVLLSVQEDIQFGDQYYLVSHHDTILFVDPDLKLLRHAPFGAAPLNLVVELAGSRGRLLMKESSSPQVRQVFFPQSTSEIRTQTGRGDLDCEIESFIGGSIGVRIDKGYLGADLDGVIYKKGHCRQWERYRLVRAETFDGLALLRRYSWLSHRDRRIVSVAPQPIDLESGLPAESSAVAATLAPGTLEFRRELVFGPARMRLVGKHPSIIVGGSGGGGHDPLARVRIPDTSGATHDFSRFTPLVLYRVCGDDSCYERLRLSLISLEKYGCFGGTVGVACDRALDELLKYIPQRFRPGLIVPASSEDGGSIDGWGLSAGLYDAYQPIVSCDMDVIFDTGITDLLIDLLLSGQACRASNVDVVGFDSIDRIRASSDVLRMTSTEANFEILERYCRVARPPLNIPAADRRGLVQFQFEPGHESAKTSAMKSYLDDLNREAPRENDAGEIVLNASIPGSLQVKELEQLARLARRVTPNGCIVEVGSLFGQSSLTLAKNAPPSTTVYCLDPWEREPWMLPLEEQGSQTLSLEAFKKNMSGTSNIISLRGHSPRHFIGWQRPIELFVTASLHSNPALHQNLTFWTRFVQPRGYICGHGYSDEFPDVKTEVDELTASLGAELEVMGTLWSIRVPDDRVADGA